MFSFIELETTSSTNEHLKNMLEKNKLPEGVVFIAYEQFAGKGQGSNTWESRAGENLTFSFLLTPFFLLADKMFLISKIVSLGIVDALNDFKQGFKIKWPNDIYFNDKKIGGVLIENQLSGSNLNYSIVGVGLNVNQKEFLSNAPNPISLSQVMSKELNKEKVLQKVLESIEKQYQLLRLERFDQINKNYFASLYRNSGFFEYKLPNKTSFKAKIERVQEDGKIILLTEQGKQEGFYFKEVQFVLD